MLGHSVPHKWKAESKVSRPPRNHDNAIKLFTTNARRLPVTEAYATQTRINRSGVSGYAGGGRAGCRDGAPNRGEPEKAVGTRGSIMTRAFTVGEDRSGGREGTGKSAFWPCYGHSALQDEH